MKELFTVFGNEVFKPLVTLFIPGGLLLTPYFLYLRWNYPKIAELTSTQMPETITVLVIGTLFLGLAIDDLGSHIEAGWDAVAENVHTENWYRYLRQAFKIEPVGHRYLRTLVLRLKYELCTYIALVLALPGTIWFLIYHLDFPGWLPFATIHVVGALWLRFEAATTHRLLQTLRQELLAGFVESPGATPITLPPNPGASSSPLGSRDRRATGIAIFLLVVGSLLGIARHFQVTGNTIWSVAVNSRIVKQYTHPPTQLWMLFCAAATTAISIWLACHREKHELRVKLLIIAGCLLVAGAIALPWFS